METGLIRNMINDKDYFKKLMAIALPVIIQSFITSSLNILDTIMVGKLGETDIAAVGIGNQIFLLFNILSMGVASGTGVFISQYWGRKDQKNIRRVFGLSLIGAAIIAILFSVFILLFPTEIIGLFNKEAEVLSKGASYIKIVGMSYIFTALTFSISSASRCLERPKAPMMVSVLALFINGTLNYAFIFGKLGSEPMGVSGAALGTLIARIVEFTVLLVYVFSTNKYLFGKLSELFDLSWEFSRKVASLVKDVLLNELLWGLAAVIYSGIYGRIGSGALAATQIYNTVQSFFLILIFGLAAGSAVMVGKEIGIDKEDTAKQYGYNSLFLSIGTGVSLSVLVFITAPYIVSLFNITEEVKYSARIILYLMALGFTVRATNIVLIVGTLRGGGDAKFGLRTEAVTMWLIGVPLALIGAFVLKLPIYGVVALTLAEEVAKFVLCIKRLFSEDWMNKVT